MRPSDRREKLLELLRDAGRLTVEELAGTLKTSQETIRRDLTLLDARGFVRKYHGGATLPEPNGEGPFSVRMAEHVREKRTIARAAAALFESGDTLFVDTGSTTIVFAEELARQKGLTVITNSVIIAQTLTRGHADNRVFLIGGEYWDEAMQNVGALAVRQLSHFHAIHAVLTVGSVESDGVMDYTMEESEVARAMVAQARRLTVLADSSKLDKGGMFRVCPLSEVDRLVTDSRPKGALAEALAAAEIELIVAPARNAPPSAR